MTGFDKKALHLSNDSDCAVSFTIEVDFLGNGKWKIYGTFEVAAQGYTHHVFPDGYSAHWLRLRCEGDCIATAYLTYT